MGSVDWDWVSCAFVIVVVAGVEAGTCSVLLLPWLWIFDSSKAHISCVAVCSSKLSTGSMGVGFLVCQLVSKKTDAKTVIMQISDENARNGTLDCCAQIIQVYVHFI